MIHTLLSILFVYAFIALGYLAKRIFKTQIDSRTLTLMSVYFMQPFVSVWGFSTAKLHWEHFSVVGIYFGIIFILLIPSIYIAKIIFNDPKKRSIFSIAGFVGNTGNIGIPLGIAISAYRLVLPSLVNKVSFLPPSSIFPMLSSCMFWEPTSIHGAVSMSKHHC